MVIFHSYVSLAEGTTLSTFFKWPYMAILFGQMLQIDHAAFADFQTSLSNRTGQERSVPSVRHTHIPHSHSHSHSQ